MPRYYFHVRSRDGLAPDLEGTPLPDIESAREEAALAARGIVANEVRAGRIVDGQEFEVRDEAGELLFTYPFQEAASPP